MIPNQEKTVNIQGSSNLSNARSQQMGIDSQSLPHLMRVLTNLYSDPEMAVIREISTNAYDSHVEAGKGEVPISVTLPTVFQPEFVVQDFGVGLSEAEVFEVFGLYGASTKRESNEYVGQLGLGCKSPLTLSNQFSLTTIKDGVRCIFSVHLDELGVGKITKLHEENTQESNGVTVSVPVPNVNSFVRKARRFYRFFPVMPEFTGGVNFPDEMVPQTIIEIDNTTRVIRSIYDDENHDFVIMGGVAYPYRSERGSRRFRSGTVVMEAPIGAVDFTPSREELHLTSRTKAFIEERYKKVEEVFAAQVQAKLDAAKDIYEFQQLLNTLQYDLKSAGITKVKFGTLNFDVSQGDGVVLPEGAKFFYIDSYSGNLKEADYYTKLKTHQLKVAAFAEDDTDTEELSSYTRTRLKLWMDNNNIKFLVTLPAGVDFLSVYKDRIIDGGKVTQIRKNANKLIQKKQNNGKWEMVEYRYGSFTVVETIPEPTEYKMVFAPRQVLRAMTQNEVSHFSSVKNDVRLFVVNKSKKKAFTESYPDAVQLDTYYYNSAVEALDSVTDPIQKALYNKEDYNSPLAKIAFPYSRVITDISKVEDIELRKALEIVKRVNDRNGLSVRNKVAVFLREVNDLITESNIDAEVTQASLTLLRKRSDTLGEAEAKGVADFIRKMQAKYPLILHNQAKEEYLIEYANLIAKGA